MFDNKAAIPGRPSLRSTAYAGSARNRREFSRPMFKGEGMLDGAPDERYAALGLVKADCKVRYDLVKKIPQS